MSVSYIEEQIREVYNFDISTSTISRKQKPLRVHQVRNSARYVVWKDKKRFSKDMKQIYDAPTKQAVKGALEDFANKWNHKYPYAIKSWNKTGKNLRYSLIFL